MISTFFSKHLFSKLFTLGLLLLFIGTLEEQFISSGKPNFFFFDSVVFFAIGVTLCLISFLFLLIEWVILPFGTQTKRIKLYQGMGNLFAFAMIVGGWLFKEEVAQNFTNSLSFSFSSSGMLVAIVFGSLGSTIADFISRKKIDFEATRDGALLSKNKTSEKFSIKENSGNALTTSRIPAVQN